MKKNVVVVAVVSVFSLPSLVTAATVGNMVDVLGGSGMMALGIEYDRIDERDLKFDSGSFSLNVPSLGIMESGPLLFPGESISNAKVDPSNRVFAKFTVGVSSNVDVYVKAGAADAEGEFDINSPPDPVEKIKTDLDTDFAWGVGAKACLWGCAGTGPRILADLQYLQYKPDTTLTVDGVDLATAQQQEFIAAGATTAAVSVDAETEIKEWQLALLAAWTVNQWRPYVGVKYSDMETDTDVKLNGQANGVPFTGDFDVQFEADDNVGAFVGTDFIVNPTLSWAVEGRCVDETAFTIGLNWKF